jgi:single-stranded-DNA-specific exonuclease
LSESPVQYFVPSSESRRDSVWLLPEPDAADWSALAWELSLPALAVRLLAQRGFLTADAMRSFLAPRLEDLCDPRLLPDIEPAVDRIATAVKSKEQILVFGDYDVDGTTGTALLVRSLSALGARVGSYTPHRAREGYGLSETGIRQAKDEGYSLIVTTDCGTTDFPEIDLARSLGIDVVVTDHHETRDHLPAALATINPKRPDSKYPFPELCGCGVAFKLAQAVCARLGRPAESLHEHLDLVALATIADIVPLSGENRILAKHGLTELARTRKPGLRALLEVTRLAGRELNSYDVGFVLGPRINASGRMAEGASSVRLLLTEDKSEARQLARELDSANNERRRIEESTVEAALRQIEQRKLEQRNVLVLADDRWHEGVIGIAASRVADRFYRPAIIIALDENRGKGSGRSIPGFHLHDALKACETELLGFGGHKYAAGLTIARDRIAAFDQAINDYAEKVLTPELLTRRLTAHAFAELQEVNPELLKALRQFEPFGPDNPRPLFAALGLEVVGFPRKVGNDHLRFTVRENKGCFLPAIAWGRAEDILSIETGKENHLDILFQFDEHSYAGKTSLQLNIKDMRVRSDAVSDRA